MRIHAFQGLRYGPAVDDPGVLAAPPFDQIDAALQAELHRREHGFARLTRPAGEGEEAREAAAELHHRWSEEGVVVRDPEPALYPYEILLAEGGRRLGVATAVGVESHAAGVIRPHERTVSKTVAERLHLLERLGVDLEPILLLAEDGGGLDALVAEDVDGGEPIVAHRDPRGDEHRLYRVADQERIEAYRELLAPAAGLIADGHHRYRVAQLYAEETGAERGTPAATKLAVLTSLASPALTIDPIHRGFAEPFDPEPLRRHLSSAVRWRGDGGAELAAAVAEAPQPALAVRLRGEAPQLWHLDVAHRPRHLPEAAGRLPVVLLHETLLPEVGLGGEAAVDGTITYRSDPERLWREVDAGDLAVGIWLPGMSGEEFAAAIARGDLLPPKSTRFLPKLVSGLVWSPHDGQLG